MDKNFSPSQVEEKIYAFWEKKGFFEAKVSKNKKPYSVILPPPNANADLHMGHAMYVYEDIMIRYQKMQGAQTLWLPGADHAGFETQYVFEQHLKKQGKSRFDYDRETLFKMIWDFVAENRQKMEMQLRKLGFALDWTKKKFTMDENIVEIVYKTFKELYDKGLIYRQKKLVNYCVRDGTSFSDLEVVDQEIEGQLFFIQYAISDNEYIEVATTRPETMLGDVAIAVNPKDKRYKKLIGKKATVPTVLRKIPIIEDESVDPKFGTGAVKVTPAHDEQDWAIGKGHDLPVLQVISYNGTIENTKTKYDGLKILKAREQIAADLNLKTKPHKMVVKTCYKCGKVLEPLPLEQWFVKVRPIADSGKKLVSANKIGVYPKKFKKILIDWLDRFHDWNISRQLVWGIRIPAWKCLNCAEWVVTDGAIPKSCPKCGENKLKQDVDTFDTWFSSSQWPFATLKTHGEDIYNYFYPTSVMETGYDILPWWVARMIMVGYFATKKEPFKMVFLHGLVRDKKGQKMSKSKGNVINPMDIVSKYGADALRAALVFNTKEGNDIPFTEDRVVGMRNFANKVWNIGRFIYINQAQSAKLKAQNGSQRHPRGSEDLHLPDRQAGIPNQVGNDALKKLQKEFKEEKQKYFKQMDSYQFAKALETVYEFLWHRFADYHLEQLKEELKVGNIEASKLLREVYFSNLKYLHPFMPYLSEEVWQKFHGEGKSILMKDY